MKSAATEGLAQALAAAPPAPLLAVQGISKSLGASATPIIGSVSFSVQPGEFLSVVGPSGCGKTTLLMCLCGLYPVDGGRILFDERPLEGPREGVSVVFQDYSRSLLPWKTNLDNVIFGMHRITDMNAKQKQDWARELLASVGLRGFEASFPWQVSGGMQQRVAIARGLAGRSRLLLLDEPLAAVDAQTRAEMQDLLLDLARKYRQTCLLVTHDVEEAVYMADRIVVLSRRPTRVVQDIAVPLDKPRDQLTTREHPVFLELRHEVISLIRSLRDAGTPQREHA